MPLVIIKYIWNKDLERKNNNNDDVFVTKLTVIGDTANVILDPILIFACHLGVTGAAIAHVFSQ